MKEEKKGIFNRFCARCSIDTLDTRFSVMLRPFLVHSSVIILYKNFRADLHLKTSIFDFQVNIKIFLGFKNCPNFANEGTFELIFDFIKTTTTDKSELSLHRPQSYLYQISPVAFSEGWKSVNITHDARYGPVVSTYQYLLSSLDYLFGTGA